MQGEELKEFSVTPEPMYDIKWIITPNAPPIFRFSKLVKMHLLTSQLLFLQGTWNLLTNKSYWL